MLNKVKEIAREAGKLMMQDITSIVDKGSAENTVTDLDVKVEIFLKEKLMSLMPQAGFIGEESEEKDFENEYLWIVDPIDGTMNFIRGLKQSAVSIALVKNNIAQIGIVFNPFLDEMYSAEIGKGAYLNGKKISVSDASFEKGLLCTAFSTYNKDYAQVCIDIMTEVYKECNDIRRFGTAAIELSYIASGKADLYFEIRLYPWDYAAGCLILKEAGGYVGTIDYDGLVYDRTIPMICANNKENYEKIRAIVLKHLPHIPYNNEL